jgi:predicted NUDIX family phosphoesterase
MLGQRAVLEADDDFRQVLPISVFLYNGKVWAYERTSKGGETRLVSKHSCLVGGHWDVADLILKDGVIDLDASLKQAVDRELEEEINLTSKIIRTTRLSKMICADTTEVDRVHLGMVWLHELDGEGIESAEDQLKAIGFVGPEELLSEHYNAEVWAKIICNFLLCTDG